LLPDHNLRRTSCRSRPGRHYRLWSLEVQRAGPAAELHRGLSTIISFWPTGRSLVTSPSAVAPARGPREGYWPGTSSESLRPTGPIPEQGDAW